MSSIDQKLMFTKEKLVLNHKLLLNIVMDLTCKQEFCSIIPYYKDRSMRYKRQTTIIFMALFFICAGLFAQQPLNLDFEKQSIEGYKRPWGWDLDSYGEGTIVYLDSIHRHNGKFSLYIGSAKNLASDTSVISYSIEPYSFKGKKVRIEGWIKTENFTGKAFLLAAYSSATGKKERSDTGKPVAQTNGWQKIALDCRLPGDLSGIVIKLIGAGRGDLWYDDLSIYMDGKKIKEAEVAPAFAVLK
jgi:hypothetical protein